MEDSPVGIQSKKNIFGNITCLGIGTYWAIEFKNSVENSEELELIHKVGNNHDPIKTGPISVISTHLSDS